MPRYGRMPRLGLAVLVTLAALAACRSATSDLLGPAGSPSQLVKVSGDDQAAAPGAALTDRPTVRVVDAGGRAIPNMMVTFAVTSGGGAIAGAQKETDADGKASVDGWTLGSTLGVNTLEATVPSAGLTATFTVTASTGAVTAPALSVGSAGGVMQPALAGSGLDGVTITVPAGAYAAGAAFNVATTVVPTGLTAMHPVARLRIDNGGAATDSLVLVRVPIRAPDGSFVTPYWYDETTKRIDPVPVVAEDSASITLAISSFSWKGTASIGAAASRTGLGGARFSAGSTRASLIGDLLFSFTNEAELLKLTLISSGYSARQDDWEFTNAASELAPFGNCLGQTLTAAWYYDVVKSSGGALFERFAPPAALRIPTLKGRDNALGYRFVSVVQADMNASRYSNRLRKWEMTSVQKRNWLRLLDAMRSTGQPQLMAVLETAGGTVGHALLAYKASPTTGDIWVADPNHPGDADRKITFDRPIGLYSPYKGGFKDGDADSSFPVVRFIPRSFVLGWDDIATRWAEFQAKTIGDVAPNAFPAYALFASRGTGTLDYAKPSVTTYDDSVTVGARQAEIRVTPFDSTGKQGAPTAVEGERRVGLQMGSNTIGAYVAGLTSEGPRFVDFQRITVIRKPLALATAAGTLVPLGDTLRFDSGVLRSFTLRYEDGAVAPDVPYVKTSVRAVSGSPGVTVTRESGTDAFTLTLAATDTGKKVVRFELWYGSRLVRNVVATVAKPSIVLTASAATYTGARTIEPGPTGGTWGVLTCKMPWTAEVLGSAQRIAIGEEYVVTPQDNNNIDRDRVTWPESEQVAVTEGTYKGTGTWWWRKYIAAGDPPSYMPFTVQWAIRYRDVATGVESTTNVLTMSCQ